MSMKLFGTLNRLAALAIAALMIGCGSPESNSGDEPPGAGAAAVDARGTDGVTGAERGRSRAVDGAEGVAGGDPAPGRDAVGEDRASAPGGSSPAAADSVAGAGAAEPGTVLFVGTSLTAGLGVPLEQSFPLLIEERIEEAGLPFRVVNAGISGETSAGALSRVDWLLRQPFDVVVLETGANDMLRGIDPEATERNIQAIIDRITEARPDATIVLAGMLALPNLGAEYGREFEAIYPRLAERNDLPFIPFLLDGVGGERDLNQSDGLHPTAEGHEVIADTVWDVLHPVLEEIEGRD